MPLNNDTINGVPLNTDTRFARQKLIPKKFNYMMIRIFYEFQINIIYESVLYVFLINELPS